MEAGNSFGKAYLACKLKCEGYPNTDCQCSHADKAVFKKKGQLVKWKSGNGEKFGLIESELQKRNPNKDKIAVYLLDADCNLISNGKGKPIVNLVDKGKLNVIGYID